jgi:hypothetical protein
MKPQFCSIHLAFNRSCFEAILIKKHPKNFRIKFTLLDINLPLFPLDLVRNYNNQRLNFLFFGSFLTMKFFTPKFVKIRWYLGIFITFGIDFQIKLTISSSSLSLTCVNMSELEFL